MKRIFFKAIFQLLAVLPTSWRLGLAALITRFAPLFFASRIKIAKRNLEICFGSDPNYHVDSLLKQHLRAFFQTILDRGVLWYGNPEKIKSMIHVKGQEHLTQAIERKEPIILLAPHFLGLDATATRLTMDVPESATMYSKQNDPVADRIIREGRSRFNQTHLISREDGIRKLVAYLKKGGIPVYYLPDMDFGSKESIFVPFFGVMTATLASTAALARRCKATVLPVVSHWDHRTGQYEVTIMPALENFPNDMDNEQATIYLNELLEDWIRKDPSQYYWVHRRFKTRPPGEKSLYD